MRRYTLVLMAVLSTVLLSGGFVASAQEGAGAESAAEGRIAAPRTISGLIASFYPGVINFIGMPDSGDGINMDNDFTEAGELVPSCTKAGNIGSDSAWFAIHHPGGTLDINTAFGTGSNFDSIVQVFSYGSLMINDLIEVGCDDDSGFGSAGNDARFQAVMPGAAYIVRIACLNCTVGVGPTDLALEIAFTPPLGAAPLSDIIDNVVPITFNRAIKVDNIGFTRLAPNENTVVAGGCDLFHSVWYRFVAPRTGTYTFSTYGSRLLRTYESQDTKIGVYSSSGGPVFANLSILGCSDDTFGTLYAALPGVSISGGTEVYVRVGTFSHNNLLPGSQYRIAVSPESMLDLGTNGSFNSGTAGWALVGTTGTDGVIDDTGNNVFRLAGSPGKIAKIKQSANFANLNFNKADEGSTVRAFVTYSTAGTISTSAKFILKLVYSDGTLPTKTVYRVPRATTFYTDVSLIVQMATKNASKVQIAIKNSSPSGEIRVDNITLNYTGSIARTRKGVGVLPPPAAPAWETRDGVKLRGSN